MNILTMIDVDYYVDMDYWLSYGLPIMIYTFVPKTAGGPVPDGEFYIVDDVVHYRINGGGIYISQLWDYSVEVLTVRTWTGTYTYSVEQYELGEDTSRRIILLSPEVFVYFPLDRLSDHVPLARRQLTFEGVNVIRTGGEVPILSVAASGAARSITIREDLFAAIKIRYTESKWKQISDIERYLSAESVPNPHILAANLFPILKILTESSPQTVTPAPTLTMRPPVYQTLLPLVTEDGKDVGRVVAPPAIMTAVTPVRSLNNDTACVKGRIIDVRNKKVPPPRFKAYAREFLAFLVPQLQRGKGCPMDLDYIWDRQGRPTQRLRSEQTRFYLWLHRFVVKSFQKAEPYAKITYPRNISTTPTDHTLRFSCYTYAFKEACLKRCRWYAPCHTPRELTNAVMSFAQNREFVTLGDFAKFDGTVSEWLEENVDDPAYLIYFSNMWMDELSRLLAQEHNAPAHTSEGVHYNTEDSRVTGSPRTTDGNTMINGFVDYAAGREEGYAPINAWDSMGLNFGDDSINGRDPAIYTATAAHLGLVMKDAQKVPRGGAVTFLSRVFINPWTCGDSIQDPLRALPKLHLSFSNENVPVEVAAYNKAYGYLTTDPTTPFISHYCRAILRVMPAPENGALTRYETELRGDIRWINCLEDESETWPNPEETTPAMWTLVASALNCDVAELHAYCELLDKCKSPSTWPQPFKVIPIKVDVPAVFEGEIRRPLAIKEGPSIESPKPPVPDPDNNNEPREDKPVPKPVPSRPSVVHSPRADKQEKKARSPSRGHRPPFQRADKHWKRDEQAATGSS